MPTFCFFRGHCRVHGTSFLDLNFETRHRVLYWNLGAWITSVFCLVIAFKQYPISPTIPASSVRP